MSSDNNVQLYYTTLSQSLEVKLRNECDHISGGLNGMSRLHFMGQAYFLVHADHNKLSLNIDPVGNYWKLLTRWNYRTSSSVDKLTLNFKELY